MSTADVERLRSIKTFPSLVKYLRDELDWPIESDDFDELTFDYEPEELGLDAKTAVKIKEIKQLRPLASNQPWGIFFVNFEPKRLPVVVLRRILRSLVLKKRLSANKPQQAAWQLHDLLFISAYGESEHRDITLANFSEGNDKGDLATLKVLGWDDEDTARHLAYSHEVLKEKLHWPDNPADLANWRHTWSQAFTLKHREVIGTSKEMAERMAELATAIRKRVNNVLAVESEKGPMRKLMTAFREALIHDLKEDDFADMYAQTITYGLLSARVSRPAGLVAENIRDMVPITNPFLRDLLSTFLTVGGRKGKVDFDELGINDVVQALRDANMEAVIRDFDDKNPQEDPVIHFYELFLKEYDPKKRMQRGVFFTPRPVVSFIVRSVDEILRKEFGLADGLADTTTWDEMAKRHPELKIPDGAKPEDPFVQILDPACGTATFLVEVIDLIHQTMMLKWREEGQVQPALQKLWNEYVADHLLPRLYGFELMMAPYAIAHMKLGLKLHETGYNFRSHERARIYLTNTLEEPKDFSDRFEFDAPALAHEAHAVNAVKEHSHFTVIIGNPPYSKISANLGEDAVRQVEPFRFVDGERVVERGALALELNLQDDYVKFYGFLLRGVCQSGVGIGSYISNFRYLDSPSLRGMRKAIMDRTSKLWFVNLGGHVAEKKGIEGTDDNVFEIEQGVAIGILCKKPTGQGDRVQYGRVTGSQEEKYSALATRLAADLARSLIIPRPPYYGFTRAQNEADDEFDSWPSLDQIFPVNSGSIITSRDSLLIDFENEPLLNKVRRFSQSAYGDKRIQEEIGFSVKAKWDAEGSKRTLRSEGISTKHVRMILYRPFDVRKIYYFPSLIDTPSQPVCRLLETSENLVLLSPKVKTTDDFNHVLVSRYRAEKKVCSHDRATQMFPLWGKALMGQRELRQVNLTPQFMKALESLALGGKPQEASPESAFHLIYSILHAEAYRERYGSALRNTYPRIPVPVTHELLEALLPLGANLVALHLLEDDYPAASWNTSKPKGKSPLQNPITKFAGKRDAKVATGYPKYAAGKLFVNSSRWLEGVPENVWNFHIGGYQVCEKWLKDRRGRALSEDDIAHYQRIVVALRETIRLMAEIDQVIDAHGGWPGAFVTGKQG